MAAIPTLAMMMAPDKVLADRAERLWKRLQRIGFPGLTFEKVSVPSRIGGGSLPRLVLPSHGVAVAFQEGSAQRTEAFLRRHTPPIVGRIEKDHFIMDARTLQDDDLPPIEQAFRHMLKKESS
jgi:L-seryl-tRNA(Ser) seleniumtransferase